YVAKAGGTDAAFLQGVYHDVLNRAMDSAGGASWGAAMAGGMTPAQVALLIATSAEARQDLIEADYHQYLQRPADAGGLAGWLNAVSHGPAPQEQVMLAAALHRHGSSEPLLVWPCHGRLILLVGYEVFPTIKLYRMPCRVVEKSFPGRAEARMFIIRHHLARQHLTP